MDKATSARPRPRHPKR